MGGHDRTHLLLLLVLVEALYSVLLLEGGAAAAHTVYIINHILQLYYN
jgi:hypothetical protein